MKKTALAAALLIASGVANATAIDSLELTGGTFSMDGANFFDVLPGVFANMTIGGYDGGNPNSADFASNSIGHFVFGAFGPVNVTTRPADDANTGFRAVSGDLTNDVLTLDLDAWAAWYAGSVFNQGNNTKCVLADFVTIFSDTCSVPMTTTYDAVAGTFTAAWGSVITDGSFKGNLGQWTITGNVTAVPVPAAVWLFGSGLIGLAGVARRRKAA